MSDSSSFSSGKDRKKQKLDESYDPTKKSNQRLCVVCRKACRIKACKSCSKPCHPKCGIEEEGNRDPYMNPYGPPVSCPKCHQQLQQATQPLLSPNADHLLSPTVLNEVSLPEISVHSSDFVSSTPERNLPRLVRTSRNPYIQQEAQTGSDDDEAAFGAESSDSLEESEEDDDLEEVETTTPQPKSKRRVATSSAQTNEFRPWIRSDIPAEQRKTLDDLTIVKSNLSLLKTPAASRPKPVEFFDLLFDSAVYNFIVEQSQLYHSQSNLKCRIMDKPLLGKFIGFLLYSGCVSLPGKEYYWDTSTRQDIVASNLSRGDMKAAKAQIHFADNSLHSNDSESGFWKVEPFVTMMSSKYQEAVKEEPYIAIDEQMTLYKGTKCPSGLKQYMPSKPISRGFKNWARAGVSGYVYEVVFYKGKELSKETRRRSSRTGEPEETPQQDVTSKTAQVVLKLTRNCSEGTFVYFDNLFATQMLLKKLMERGLHFVCTFRAPRLKNCPLENLKTFQKKPRGN